MNGLYPRLNQVRTKRLQRSTSAMPCLNLSYSLANNRSNTAEWPTSQKDGLTVAIDADGGGASQFRMTITDQRVDQTGTATTDNTYVFDGAAAGSGTVTAVCATLYDLIKAINANIPQCKAWAGDAPHFLSLADDGFEDLASTEVPSNGYNKLQCLYRTPASGDPGYMRVGIPEVRDNGHIRIQSLRGFCTGNTNGTVKIYRDAYEDNLGSSDVVPLHQSTLATAETEIINKDISDALTYKGPIIVEINSGNLTAYDYVIGYMQGDV